MLIVVVVHFGAHGSSRQQRGQDCKSISHCSHSNKTGQIVEVMVQGQDVKDDIVDLCTYCKKIRHIIDLCWNHDETRGEKRKRKLYQK